MPVSRLDPSHPSAPGRDYTALFGSVMANAAPAPATTPRTLELTKAVSSLIDACDTALTHAFEDPPAADVAPGVCVPDPWACVLAYLLFLINTRSVAEPGVDQARFGEWYDRLGADIWHALAFPRQPAKMTLSLAFGLLGEPEHQARELRGLIWLVGDLAACGLLGARP